MVVFTRHNRSCWEETERFYWGTKFRDKNTFIRGANGLSMELAIFLILNRSVQMTTSGSSLTYRAKRNIQLKQISGENGLY